MTVGNCDFATMEQFVDMLEKHEIINRTNDNNDNNIIILFLAMSAGQRQYLHAYSQGNYREMMWALLQNRRWISDYMPKEDFFAYLEKSGNADMKKLWDYE